MSARCKCGWAMPDGIWVIEKERLAKLCAANEQFAPEAIHEKSFATLFLCPICQHPHAIGTELIEETEKAKRKDLQ